MLIAHNKKENLMTLRQKVYNLLENDNNRSKWNKAISVFIVLLIVTNVVAIIVESYAPIGQKYATEFKLFNLISVIIFTIEYLARLWICVESPKFTLEQPVRSRLKYFFSPVAFIDLLAIAPFYLAFIFPIDLRYLRMLRMLRLLKLTHYFKGLNLFACVLYKELPTIGAAISTMVVLVILSASIMYSVESEVQPEAFGSIPSAMWWAVVTLTTVGYGDVTPVTFLGKFITIFIMLLGVGIVALPAAMLAAKFGDELRHRKKRLEVEVDNAMLDGIVTDLERADLDKLADSLDLSTDTLEQLIETRTLEKAKVISCPHCEKPVYIDRGNY